MLWRGFRFGMMLQLAVGPVCLFVFLTAVSSGWIEAMAIVLAATLVDALYIVLSGLGVAAFMKRPGVQRFSKIFGGVVLLVFGSYMCIQAFQGTVPNVAAGTGSPLHSFLEGGALTLSNPLTIVFWGGVLAAETAQYHLTHQQLAVFGTGCILSTIFFLTIIGIAGTVTSSFLPMNIIIALNGIVGIALMYFGIRLWRK